MTLNRHRYRNCVGNGEIRKKSNPFWRECLERYWLRICLIVTAYHVHLNNYMILYQHNWERIWEKVPIGNFLRHEI